MPSSAGAATSKRCAYCSEPFCFSNSRVEALEANGRLVCSEFCAQALREEAHLALKRAAQGETTAG